MFTNDTIDALITLKEDDNSGDVIDNEVTISGNTITIDPDSNLADGVVYVALSNGWYYGLNPTKSQGTASNITFTMDTAAPPKPTGLDLAAADDTGVSNELTTSRRTRPVLLFLVVRRRIVRWSSLKTVRRSLRR